MNRLVFAAIVLFWLTMTTLLVRMQIRPEDSALREVPPARVLSLIFEHEQPSNLNIKSGELRYGAISVYPKSRENGTRVIDYGGNTLLRAPYLPHDRLAIEGQLGFDTNLRLQSAQGSLALRDDGTSLSYRIDPAKKTLEYSLEQKGTTYRRDTIALDRAGLDRLAPELGIDPSMLESAMSSSSGVSLTAHYSHFGYREERVESYSLVLKRENTTLIEIFVSQLGQILLVKTPFGLELAPGDLLP